MPLSPTPSLESQLLEELRHDIKAALKLQRLPRAAGVNVFLYLVLLYRNDRNKLYRAMFDQILEDIEQEPLDGSLAQSETGTEQEPLDGSLALRGPCTTYLKETLGMCTRHYAPYLQAFCVLDETWQYKGEARVRQLLDWTPLAHTYLARWASRIPVEWEMWHWRSRGFGVSTENLGPLASSIQPFYISTPKSPHRNYHVAQSMTRAEKEIAYAGCVDVDIVSCFASLFWHEMGGKNSTIPQVWLLDPAHSDYLLDRIKESFGCDHAGAKKRRSALFMGYRNNYEYSSGHAWYDELHTGVIRHVRSLHPDETLHQVFTRYEKRVREAMATGGVVELDMHDGLIFRTVDLDMVESVIQPHRCKWKRW